MDELTKGVLSVKLLEACDSDINSAIYTFTPTMGEDLRPYTHNLHNLPQIIDLAIEVFTGKKTKITKNSIYYPNLKKNKERLIKLHNGVCELTRHKGEIKTNQDKVQAALSAINCLYLDAFTTPTQFFLPHSSVCSGKWDFWDNVDFFLFKEKLKNKEFNSNIRKKIMKSKVWNPKFDIKEFPPIIQRRLIKDKLLDKKLSPESMIKAIIMRMGEMAKPGISYEIIDFSIRSFFTYLGSKKYLRADREMEFLKRIEKEIINIFI